ncbi:MAG: patatin family protein [Coriobacteriales bacterium]|nr:patatin family protein [Coriobacteriales bacterium]
MDKNKTGNALVLEGGGYRGVFTAGVLDVLMERGIYGFDSVWGTSAGALNGASFCAHQLGRNIRVMLAFRDDPRLMSFRSLVKTGNLTSGEFLYHTVQNELDPFDSETFNASPTRMFAVVTDVAFGAARYLEVKSIPRDLDMIQASASLPLVSGTVEIDGREYLDGGTTDSVPLEVALGLAPAVGVEDYEPASKALVVLTQHREYVKGQKLERMALLSRRYTNYPMYIEALSTRPQRYMAQRERIWELEREGRALVLLPKKPVEVDTNEHDGAPLLDLYLQGRRQAEERINEIVEFLE